MKAFLFAALAAVSITLGGCASTGGGGTTNPLDYVQQLISTVSNQCPFVLSAGSAAQLIATVSGNAAAVVTVAMLNQLASEVCSAISKPRGARVGAVVAPPVVRGVVIQGSRM